MTRRTLNRFILLVAVIIPPSMPAQTLTIDPDALGLPESVDARLRQQIAREDWPRAEALLFSLAERSSPPAPLMKALAVAHLQCGRYLQAATAYRRADRMHSLDPASRFALANAYLGLEKRHWARRELERLAREDPGNPDYPNALAGIFQDYQWFDMAEAQARRAIAIDPSSSSAYDRLGQALEGRNEAAEAQKSYRLALERDRASKKRSPWPAFHLGRLLLETGRAAEALRLLEGALEADPNHVEATYQRALALSALDRHEEAVAELHKAALLAPAEARILYALSQAYRRLGKIAEARESIRRFQELSTQ